MFATKHNFIKTLLLLVLAAHISIWFSVRDIRGQWSGVPPVPASAQATALAVGDSQLAYRLIGIMLQNLGDTGGRSEKLVSYDYSTLTNWFSLADSLDKNSNFVPFLAAFYYGAVLDKARLRVLLDYLYQAGQKQGSENWRFLAHGVYLARYQMQDLDLALKFARALASLKDPYLPTWARQMPVFVLNARGDKEEALSIMVEILKTSSDKVDPSEVNVMHEYICTQLLEKKESLEYPLCKIDR